MGELIHGLYGYTTPLSQTSVGKVSTLLALGAHSTESLRPNSYVALVFRVRVEGEQPSRRGGMSVGHHVRPKRDFSPVGSRWVGVSRPEETAGAKGHLNGPGEARLRPYGPSRGPGVPVVASSATTVTGSLT